MSEPLEQLHKPVDLLGMPLWRARVELAKDVLAALELNVFRPAAQSAYFWMAFRDGVRGREEDRDLRDVFANKDFSRCEVCGLGALFVAKICRLDRFMVPHRNVNQVGQTSCHGAIIKNELHTFFSYEQMTLIECAFEVSEHHARHLPGKVVDAAVLFGNEYTNDRERLRAIMQNIIQNKGEFVP